MPAKKGTKLKCGKCRKLKKDCHCGRPTKKNDALVKKLVECFEYDMTIEEACSVVGISSKTFREWIKHDEKFRTKINGAMQVPFIRAKKVVMKSILDDNVKDAQWLLEHRKPNLYSTKQVHEVAPVEVEELDERRKTELDKLIDENL